MARQQDSTYTSRHCHLPLYASIIIPPLHKLCSGNPHPPPTMEDAVEADSDFFEGATQDGAGPGPHFLTMSFIKDKTRIRDQILKALSSTVSILAQNVPGVLVHCIQKYAKLPLLSSATASNFPTTGMMARNYMFIPKLWSLQPGTRNKPKPCSQSREGWPAAI